MVDRCICGNCDITCPQACYCIADADDPSIFQCDCIPPIFKKPLNKKGGKNKSRKRLKVTRKGRFNLCAHKAPVTALAQIFEKSLPNRILVPAKNLNKKVTLGLKNKTFEQIARTIGLALKS